MKSLRSLPLILLAALQSHADDGLDAGLMRMPAVSERQLAFVYAGDIWIAPKEGGTAFRLSSPQGEELFPRFSPDGREIAFTANYDGNDSIYVIPVSGGEPRRVTYHGSGDRMVCWWPDGGSIVFASRRESFTERVGQFFRVNAQGGLPARLPVPYGEFGAVSPDGKTFAYTMTDTDRASWKRYRGGMAPDIWLFGLDSLTAVNATADDACDSQPMWVGKDRVYFLSDRGERKRANLWCYDIAAKSARQVTKFTDYDVRYPSVGPREIVFENGGGLFLLDLATERSREVKVDVVTDKATLRPRVQNVGGLIRTGSISPSGRRVLFEARGDIFSVPAENGVIRNLTESPGVAERYPAWSPDGKWIAYFSDRSGEYELTLRAADGTGEEKQVTELCSGWRYSPHWSPDSRKIVFIDSSMRIWLSEMLSDKADSWRTTEIDRQLWMYHGELESFHANWSADSRWLTYAGDTPSRQQAIILYDTRERRRHQVTSAYYDDDMPVFDPAGNWLFYRSKRMFQRHSSEFDNTWAYVNSHSLMCVPLRKDMPSPLAPKNDEEPVRRDEPKKEVPKETPKSNEPAKQPEDSKKSGAAIAGVWTGRAQTPKGEVIFSLALQAEGNAVSGNFTFPGIAWEFSGKFDPASRKLTGTARGSDTPDVTIDATLDGDTLSGVSNVPGRNFHWKAQREAGPQEKPAGKPDGNKPAVAAENKPGVRAAPGAVRIVAAPPPTAKPAGLKIDIEGFEARAIVLPVGSGRLDQIDALPGKVLFRWPPRAGSNNRTSPLSYYDVDARAERMVLDDVGAYEISADKRRILVSRGGSWYVTGASEGAKADKALPTSSLEATVDPVAEWRQMFDDAWRIERDYFYDPHLHLVHWQSMRDRYRRMIDACVTRHDVNYVLGELLGELNSSHAYRSGGDLQDGPRRRVGYLGCDYAFEQGAYRIQRILDVAPWDTGVRSPLRAPGITVKEGDWLLAVNGRKLDTRIEPAAAFQGLAEKTVILTVNTKPSMDGAREVILQTLGTESALRHYAWVEQNRRRIDQATGGRAGYIYVKNTGTDGQTELFRQWRAQAHKDALIIDERWNAGGQIPDRFIELLNRPVTNYWGVRDGADWQTPFIAHDGPKVMLANRWSGSGGDCFPWLFQQMKLGPVIGTRTWGGLIGMTGCPPLVDGGTVTVPTLSIYDRNGQWIIEGTGVKPDIEVIDDPAQLARGTDPQIERSITEVLALLKSNPPRRPNKPPYTDRTR